MIKRVFFAAASRLVLHPLFRLTRGMTLGVRVAVFNEAGEVFLIRHTYAPGWLLPGGGVERGETLPDAAKREIREEGGIVAAEPLALHGLFSNHANFPGDHVAVYVLRRFTREAWSPNAEIAEAGFFPQNVLPEGTTGGTRRRIAEIAGGLPPQDIW
jgi:8-oxo-dGTP pyrophosphatase MutT (NUDIX family)